MNETRKALVENITECEHNLTIAKNNLLLYDNSPEANVYDNLENALNWIENDLMIQAHADCEGSHNCGKPEYTRNFIIDGKFYRATLAVDYNRHDKTYYYVDGSQFSYAEIIR